MVIDLVSGIVSSLLAVAMVETYLLIRRHLKGRHLRLALGNPSSCTIVVPEFPSTAGKNTISLVGTYDAYAMAYVLQAYYRLGINPASASLRSLPDGVDGDVVCIGGPYVNSMTDYYLKHYCPGFKTFAPEESDELSSPSAYQCGNHKFLDKNEETWAFIVQLGPDITQGSGMVILVWGPGAVGTAAAGYFLARYSRRLPSTVGGSAFSAVRVERPFGYRAVSTSVIQLKQYAFERQP